MSDSKSTGTIIKTNTFNKQSLCQLLNNIKEKVLQLETPGELDQFYHLYCKFHTTILKQSFISMSIIGYDEKYLNYFNAIVKYNTRVLVIMAMAQGGAKKDWFDKNAIVALLGEMRELIDLINDSDIDGDIIYKNFVFDIVKCKLPNSECVLL